MNGASHGHAGARGQRLVRETERGFAALAIVVMICAMLALTVLPASLRGHLARLDALDGEYRAASRELALACRDAARLALSRGLPPPDRVPVGPGTDSTECAVDTVVSSSAGWIVVTSGEYPWFGPRRSRTTLRAEFIRGDHTMLSTQDVSGCDSRAPPAEACD